MAIIIANQPFETFSYLGEDPLNMVLAWSIDTDALTNACEFYDGITRVGLLLDQLDFKLQVDASTEFNTINLKEYTKDNALEYRKGMNVFSMVVPVPKRRYDKELNFYWRVKHELSGVSMSVLSEYCTESMLSISKNETLDIANKMHNNLADENVYTKDTNSTNIYALLKDYAAHIEQAKFELKRIKEVNSILQCKESLLQSKHGRQLDFSKPSNMSYAEYKVLLNKLTAIYKKAGTLHSIREIIKLMTGAYPIINEYRKKYGWIIHATRRDPMIDPFPTPEMPFPYNDPAAHFFPVNDLDPYTGFVVPKAAPISRADKAFTTEIIVNNPFLLDLDKDLLAAAIYKLKPAHTKVVLFIKNAYGEQEVYSYWDLAYSGTYYFSSEDE